MPRTPVAQLKLGMTLAKVPFLLRERNASVTRTGSSMLRVTLADSTGTIAGVYFDAPASLTGTLTVGQGVEVSGRVGEYKDQLQVAIDRIAPTQLAHLEIFLPTARRPIPDMVRELDQLRASVRQPNLAALLQAILGDPDMYQAFTHAPAAKVNHHACVGGLLEHTLSIVHLVLAACDLYPELDHDLAVTVALLHDLGKVRAYDPTSFASTDEGSLWTHLYMGASIVERAIEGLGSFAPELRLRVIHAILAHHGKLEYGSPVLPMTLEAIVLHHADHLDGDARGALDQFERTEDASAAFTERSLMHETRLFRGATRSLEPTQPQFPSVGDTGLAESGTARPVRRTPSSS